MIYPIVDILDIDGVRTVPASGALVLRENGTIAGGWCYPGQIWCELPTSRDVTDYDCIDMRAEEPQALQSMLGKQHEIILTKVEGGWERVDAPTPQQRAHAKGTSEETP